MSMSRDTHVAPDYAVSKHTDQYRNRSLRHGWIALPDGFLPAQGKEPYFEETTSDTRPRGRKDIEPVLPMNQRPSAVIRDVSGAIVPTERWDPDQRRQARESIIGQFRGGFQRGTLEEVRDEMAARWSYVQSWEEEQAVREWILRQLDGLIQRGRTGQANHNAAGTGAGQFPDPFAARKNGA